MADLELRKAAEQLLAYAEQFPGRSLDGQCIPCSIRLAKDYISLPSVNDYEGYGWIKVKKYKMDESLSWEERYRQLDQHHIEETSFLINKVRELAQKLAQSNED